MKIYAGKIYLEAPGDWEDESNYVYRKAAADIEIRVERTPAGPAATPDVLLDKIQERLKKLGPMPAPKRGTVQIDGREGKTMSVRSKREGDKETSLMEVVIFKVGPDQAITITALGPERKQADFLAAWKQVLSTTKVME